MKNIEDFYQSCRGCGERYGRGKGVFGLARHDCDAVAKYLVKFFLSGVSLEMCSDALDIKYQQAEALLRERMP